jgi:hypothetical protein
MVNEAGDADVIDEKRLDQILAGRWRWDGLAPALRPCVHDPRMTPALRRFACACCRAVQDHLTEDSIEALAVIERFAYGRASFEELVYARDSAKLAARRVRRRMPRDRQAVAAGEAVCHAGRNQAFEALLLTSRAARQAGLTIQSQAGLLSGIWSDVKRETERHGTS